MPPRKKPSRAPEGLPLWARLGVLLVGLVLSSIFAADRLVNGTPGDPVLVYAALAIVGLGAGATIDWFRGGPPK